MPSTNKLAVQKLVRVLQLCIIMHENNSNLSYRTFTHFFVNTQISLTSPICFLLNHRDNGNYSNSTAEHLKNKYKKNSRGCYLKLKLYTFVKILSFISWPRPLSFPKLDTLLLSRFCLDSGVYQTKSPSPPPRWRCRIAGRWRNARRTATWHQVIYLAHQISGIS